MWATNWASRWYAERVRSLAIAWRPDIVQFEHHIMGQYLGVLDGCNAPRVLTEHEPAVHAAPYLKRTYPIVNGVLDRLDKLAWSRFEPRVLGAVQTVVVFTGSDQQAIERVAPSVPVLRIPLGTALPDEPLDPLGCLPMRLVFVGSYLHAPNIRAALRLALRIFPVVRLRYPELELELVGEKPPLELRKLHGGAITVTGRVPDVMPHLDAAAIFVAPISSGGGMRVKVLEALAAGKAVVASPLAAQGLDVRDGEELVLADSDAEFADRIVELLDDPARRAALAGRARQWAGANLRWERSVEAYVRLYESLLVRREAA